MTLSEFSNEFDVLYNNISSGAAPGINAYEKSLLLTNAQEELIKAYYSGDIQKLVPSFEENERRRRELGELVRTYISEYDADLNNNLAGRKIHNGSVFFAIPNDVLYILHEQAGTYNDPCTEEGRGIKIIPTKLDYFNTQISNPFRRPNEKKAWRLDLESYNSTRIVEIVNRSIPIRAYYLRYIHKPAPIILENFENDPELSGMGLSIYGINSVSNSELPSIAKEIIYVAVMNAILRYRENSLQNISIIK